MRHIEGVCEDLKRGTIAKVVGNLYLYLIEDRRLATSFWRLAIFQTLLVLIKEGFWQLAAGYWLTFKHC